MNRSVLSPRFGLVVVLGAGLWGGCSSSGGQSGSSQSVDESASGSAGASSSGASTGNAITGASGGSAVSGGLPDDTGSGPSGAGTSGGFVVGPSGTTGSSGGAVVGSGSQAGASGGSGSAGSPSSGASGAGGDNAGGGAGASGSASGSSGPHDDAGSAATGEGAGGDASVVVPAGCTVPATVSFQQDVQPFLMTSCGNNGGTGNAGTGGCHVIDASSTKANGGYDHAYDWITGTAHSSSCPEMPTPFRFQVVIAVINEADPASCSKSRKMPPDTAHMPLTACQIATLQSWLDEPLVTQTHRADGISPTTPYAMPPFN